jgi:hypothetical protein
MQPNPVKPEAKGEWTRKRRSMSVDADGKRFEPPRRKPLPPAAMPGQEGTKGSPSRDDGIWNFYRRARRIEEWRGLRAGLPLVLPNYLKTLMRPANGDDCRSRTASSLEPLRISCRRCGAKRRISSQILKSSQSTPHLLPAFEILQPEQNDISRGLPITFLHDAMHP